ncbi:MAG: HU family DNA-binding protein [Deltaproteobacteria bacterium]|nr:HU family DNA-binding protein [Deltaproteobacteria bacterium]
MTRAELIEMIAQESNINSKEVERVIRIFTEKITSCVSLGEKITISGFGTFEKRRRKATFARNPKTGETMPIAEQNVATFRAGTAFKSAVKAVN